MWNDAITTDISLKRNSVKTLNRDHCGSEEGKAIETLVNIEHDLSRSLHALEFIDATSGDLPSPFTAHRTRATTIRRRKSEAELGAGDELDCGRLAAHENDRASLQHGRDRPVHRRRRFTRKQRKSVTIDPETSLILATRRHSSSSEEEEQKSGIRSTPADLVYSRRTRDLLAPGRETN
ncbi:hypothetical protein KIN20_023673 [Parelaphostrongylus tenuis]|uniref:Uncharacterized protein n=1 Tax=Parelaphostrongylus tenuis TaxID=148309 RepID=A0AAD5QXG1_PARTN|nr:hypothetical protein KIN20_023673 [Parelaphostrongylus tenuis]